MYDTPQDEEDFYSKDDKYCPFCGARYPEDEEFHTTLDNDEICNTCNNEKEN